MSARLYISRDSGALCVGAEEVATAFGKAFEKIRFGTQQKAAEFWKSIGREDAPTTNMSRGA